MNTYDPIRIKATRVGPIEVQKCIGPWRTLVAGNEQLCWPRGKSS